MRRVFWFHMLRSAAFALALISQTASAADLPEVSLFSTPSGGNPYGIAKGPDGALWFTEYSSDTSGNVVTNSAIGRISINGVVTEYPLPSSSSGPQGIVAGPDGALWFFEHKASKIGRITVDGAITEFPIQLTGGYGNTVTGSITVGSDGALWFPKGFNYSNFTAVIGRITTAGVMSEFPLGMQTGMPMRITAGSDGALWIVGYPATAGPNASYFVRMTTSGVATQYAFAESTV